MLLKFYCRRKGDNAQQVIDLTAALKVNFENIHLKIFAPLKNICCEGERGSDCGEAGRHRDAGGGAGGGEGGPQDRGRADRRARVHQSTAQGRRWGKYFTSENILTDSGRVSSSPACPEQCGDEASGDSEGE